MTAQALLYAPADLIEVDQWVLWRRERDTKVPYQPNGKRASTTDLTTWREYTEVWEHWQKYQKHYDGIGFVFSEHDPFCGIDLDDCLDGAGNPKAWARPIIERFSDTYIEISPSGFGIKIWCKGTLPAAVNAKVEDGAIEVYDRRRYFTVTGRKFRCAPDQVEDHQADVMTLYERLSGRLGPRYEVPTEGTIPKGERHKALVSFCGTLRRRGICEQAIEACLQAVNRYQCEEPKPPGEISKIVASSRPWSRP
jgi:primase-polymerase (primpol)-like protein